jgi:hypothetical protein
MDVKSQRPRPSGRGLKKANNSLAASIPTIPGGALKGGGKRGHRAGVHNLYIQLCYISPYGMR